MSYGALNGGKNNDERLRQEIQEKDEELGQLKSKITSLEATLAEKVVALAKEN